VKELTGPFGLHVLFRLFIQTQIVLPDAKVLATEMLQY
jgi:hypothetical protein